MKEELMAKVNAIKGINDLSMKGEIVVFGSTYMSKFPLYELVNKCQLENAVYNRSFEGLTIDEALAILNVCVLDIKPKKVFLSLGEEDRNDKDAITKYNQLIRKIRRALPDTKIYLITLTGSDEYSMLFNNNIRQLCADKQIKYIDFVATKLSEAALIKARFKQLICFFRNQPLNMSDAYTVAHI